MGVYSGVSVLCIYVIYVYIVESKKQLLIWFIPEGLFEGVEKEKHNEFKL